MVPFGHGLTLATYDVKPLKKNAPQQTMIDDKLLGGEYRIRLRGPLSVDYLGRTTAQQMPSPGGGRRLVFWAPEALVKLAIPKGVALGTGPIRSLDQVIAAETGTVSGIGIAVVMRREGLDRELYMELLSGTLTLESRKPLTGHLRCEVTNGSGKNLEVDLAFLKIGPAG